MSLAGKVEIKHLWDLILPSRYLRPYPSVTPITYGSLHTVHYILRRHYHRAKGRAPGNVFWLFDIDSFHARVPSFVIT